MYRLISLNKVKEVLTDKIPSLNIMPETTDLFWHTTFFAKFNMLRSLSMHFLGNIEEAYTPNYFPVGQGHNFPHKVWKDFFYKSFSWQMGDNLL